MPDWYVFDEGTEKGPFPDQALIEYLRTRDPAFSFVWHEGFDKWVLARDLPDIMRVLRPAPPISVTQAPESDTASDLSGTQNQSAAKKRKGKWAKIGSLIGLILSVANLVVGRRGASDADTLGYIIGYVGGAVLLGAFVGFVCGAITDLFKGSPRQIIATIEIPKRRTASRYNNIIAMHWRGEFPLWVSYWVFGFIGNFLVGLIPVLTAAVFRTDSGFYPPAIFSTIVATWIGVVVVLIWQLVGVWRSAAFYTAARVAAGRGAPWAALAQVAVILGFFGVLASFMGEGLPQIAEAYRIALRDDPDIPPYSIRVMRDGTEVEIVGGIKYGLADDFEKILNASRQIKVVHLDSIGGRLGEGEKLFKRIRDRGLDT